MIIDHHVHLGRDINRTGYSLSPEDLIKNLDAHGIDSAIVFSCPNILPSSINPYRLENSRILEITEANPR